MIIIIIMLFLPPAWLGRTYDAVIVIITKKVVIVYTSTINPKKLETGIRTISAGIPYTLLLRIEAIRFPTFGLLLYINEQIQSMCTCM